MRKINVIDSLNGLQKLKNIFPKYIYISAARIVNSIENIVRMLWDTADTHTHIQAAIIVISANLSPSHAHGHVVYNSGGPVGSLSQESLLGCSRYKLQKYPESALQISPVAVYSLAAADTKL